MFRRSYRIRAPRIMNAIYDRRNSNATNESHVRVREQVRYQTEWLHHFPRYTERDTFGIDRSQKTFACRKDMLQYRSSAMRILKLIELY